MEAAKIAQTVLIIDDRPNISDMVQSSLTEQGYHVVVASDATAGMEMVALEKPDMLIIGLALPDAFAMLQHLRENPQIPRLPVITILKLWAQETDIRKGWDLGVDAFLPRLFNRVELSAFVRRIFKSIDEDQSSEARWTRPPL